ncbi:MAG: tetratricopeptide repeat protein [Planctomycetes bacterium]|nr:tetratricopeptide repeat protein [Planctomycetota bacterium]
MSDVPRLLSIRSSLSGRWQVPVLLAGGLLFAASLSDMVWKHRPVTFKDQVTYVKRLREAKAYERASAYLIDQMKTPRRPASERGELARMLAQVVYDVESVLTDHRPENVRALISNYQLAQRYGAALDPRDWIALGDGYDWACDEARAADAYREAIRRAPDAPDRLRRRLLEFQLASSKCGPELSAEGIALIDQILAGESASPRDYAWALEVDVTRLLEAGNSTAALARVEKARTRLSGTEELLGVTYLEALCKRNDRQFAEAEALLRSLRDEWSKHDELWGKAGWLLGRVQQESGRPELAVAAHEEVLKTFHRGPVHSLCELGLAESLAAVGRQGDAFELFKGILDPDRPAADHKVIDLGSICATLGTVGDSLVSRQSLDLGIKYLELALKHTAATEHAARLVLTTRLASAYEQTARLAMTADPKAKSNRNELLARSAEMHLQLSNLLENQEEASVRALEQAVAEFDAAGLRDRVIEVLNRYASTKVNGVWRSTALYQLGRAYQAAAQYADAISAYEDLIQTYPRMPDALRSMVPLAECLLAAGHEQKPGAAGLRAKGVALLEGIVKDQARELIFAPTATEYCEALYRLAEHFSRTSDAATDHLERAIAYWEDWLALYPDDARRTSAQFMLADDYRRSAQWVAKSAEAATTESMQSSCRTEAESRFNTAQQYYERVIESLAGIDASRLSPRDDRYLRASYLYRADCLFDLGRYAEALSAYSETAWRYENQPTAIAASVQAAHCQQRLGRPTEAGAALARARWLLAKIPASAFEIEFGQPSKDEWRAMVERIEKAGLF